MFWIILGVISFICYILYDVNQIKDNCPIFRPLFLVASILLLVSTVMLIVIGHDQLVVPQLWRIIAAIISGVSLWLMIYSLFFALPFHDTYVATSGKASVYDRGMYALCRHPGVLWFILFYAFLWLAAASMILLWAGIAFSIGNVIYIILQDRYFFPRLFNGYCEYRRVTPFLIPHAASIKRCFATWHK